MGPDGGLKDETLIAHPRCGAGSGLKLDRVLEKLGLRHEEVDGLLGSWIGEPGAAARAEVPVRADRCGVFSASATISDKNQGLPLALALATTLKSEVWKVCGRLPPGFEEVWLTGGVFRWRYARDCAADRLAALAVRSIRHDAGERWMLDGMQRLAAATGTSPRGRQAVRAQGSATAARLGSLGDSHGALVAGGSLRRLAPLPLPGLTAGHGAGRSLDLGLDVGSTMAKLAVADARSGELLHLDAVSNAGDTIETVKTLLGRLAQQGSATLRVRHVGVTGSARYQVREALARCYPALSDRVGVLVENEAHARGALGGARQHLEWLRSQGAEGVEAKRFVLIDVGGEDTKVSVVDLARP